MIGPVIALCGLLCVLLLEIQHQRSEDRIDELEGRLDDLADDLWRRKSS